MMTSDWRQFVCKGCGKSLALQPSEQTTVTAAATIYVAYITAGGVEDGKENTWTDRALKAAFRIAKVTDETVQADWELD